MSDESPPPSPTDLYHSHLYTEPIAMSFISPQQLAQLGRGRGNLLSPSMPNPAEMFFQQMGGSHPMMSHHMPPSMPNHHMSPSMPSSAEMLLQKLSGSHPMMSHHMPPSMPPPQPLGDFVTVTPEPAPAEAKVLHPLPAQQIDLNTFKGFKFVTLDPFQIETREIYDKISGTYVWENCESQEERCVQFIREKCTNKRVFFITSGSLGEKIVPQIHDLPQLYAIYVYCANVKHHKEWSKNYQKIRVVCDNDDIYLLPKFAVDVAQSNIDWGDALLKQGNREKAKEKFELALKKLTDHANNHDKSMDEEIKNKLEACK